MAMVMLGEWADAHGGLGVAGAPALDARAVAGIVRSAGGRTETRSSGRQRGPRSAAGPTLAMRTRRAVRRQETRQETQQETLK